MRIEPLFLVGFALFLVERLAEIAIHRRNATKLRARGARFLREDGFLPILLAQIVLFGGLLVEELFAPWAGTHPWTVPAIAILVLAQALRYWAIVTLGERWAIRVVTLPGAPRIVGGPYRFLPHPNYLAVVVEAIALPLAFGAFATLAIVVPLHLASLRRRIRLEERALRDASPAS